MKFLILLGLIGCSVALPQFIASPYLYSGLGAPIIAPGATSSQFHAQDELGSYSYGYAGGPSAKTESKTPDGVTRGSYSYIDANGIQQTVNYVSDPVNGFRVAATNLPVQPAAAVAAVPVAHAALPIAHHVPVAIHPAGAPLDTPEVAVAKAQHFAAHAEARARNLHH